MSSALVAGILIFTAAVCPAQKGKKDLNSDASTDSAPSHSKNGQTNWEGASDRTTSKKSRKHSKKKKTSRSPFGYFPPLEPKANTGGTKGKHGVKGGVHILSSKSKKFQKGDRIVSIKDSKGASFPIHSQTDLENFLKVHRPNEKLTMRVERAGRYHVLVISNITKNLKF